MNAQQKIEATKQAILLLLASSGPQDIAQIIAECKVQAFAGLVAESLRQLTSEQAITFDHDEQAFDII